MKASAFELSQLSTIADARNLLTERDAICLAGGQSLGPMLNFRAARPSRLVALGGVMALRECEDRGDTIIIGACVTHATIEDGKTPDIVLEGRMKGLLSSIASGIAYRAVRNRGTIGGSLCHADPAADWPTTLMALNASVLLSSGRDIKLSDYIVGAYQTNRSSTEIVTAVSIPRPSPKAGWGYYKACRKPGEFAHAMAAVLLDPARGTRRAVIGATGGKPTLLLGDDVCVDGVSVALSTQRMLDPIVHRIQANVFLRALDMAEETR